MFIVDYSKDYYGSHEETSVFPEDNSVISFAAEKSVDKNFQIVRINKYEKGVLYPYSLTLKQGRIILQSDPLNMGGKTDE